MAKLSPVFNDQTIDANGDPAVAYQLFTYVAGSSTKQTTYSDDAGTIQNSNPIILNSLGYPTQGPIWLLEGSATKFVLAPPTDTDPPTSPVKTIDDVTGVGDNTVSVTEWQVSGLLPTYISTTSFSLLGDQTSNFHTGRRLQFTTALGTVYGTISTSVFTTLTTITMVMDGSQVLDSGLSAVNLSILRADHLSEPYSNSSETILGVKTFASSPIVPTDFKWQCMPIGGLYEVDDSLTGVEIPPIDNPLFRYIKLTAGLTGVGAYNEGCLTSESVTGSAPLVIATAVVSLTGSPMNGQTIDLLNTEERALRAGTSAGTKLQDALQNVTGSFSLRGPGAGTDVVLSGTGGMAISTGGTTAGTLQAAAGSVTSRVITFDASTVARTATETRSKSLTVTVYQRIL